MTESIQGPTRRQFLKGAGTGAAAMLVDPRTAIQSLTSMAVQEPPKVESNPPLSRKEYFKPFENGHAQWQYVQFQYTENCGEQIGVTVSISELVDPRNGEKTQQLLVSSHNLTTQTSVSEVFTGQRTFDEITSTYTFTDTKGNSASLAYDEKADSYSLSVQTSVFNTSTIDPNGIVLNPRGNLIPVSKTGHFTVAAYNGGRIGTNYFADNVAVSKSNGEIIGYGRRDSENLVVEGGFPLELDIDHSWVHVCGTLEDNREVYITAWQSTTGGDFRFADIMLYDPATNESTIMQVNQDSTLFKLTFESNENELEDVEGETMAHGGKVTAILGVDEMFQLEIDGDKGQIINGKGLLNMVEAHGRLVDGTVLGIPLSGKSAMWETTREEYETLFLPLYLNRESNFLPKIHTAL